MALSCARTLPVALGRRRRRPRFQMLDKAVLPTISAMRLVGVVDTHAPLNRSAKPSASTRSSGSAGVSPFGRVSHVAIVARRPGTKQERLSST